MNKKKLFVLLLAAVALSVGIALSPRAIALVFAGDNSALITRFSGPSETSPKTIDKTAQLLWPSRDTAAGNQTGQTDATEVEVITATPGGFDPQGLTRSRGSFILAVHNMSGEPELEVRVARVRGERLHELRLGGGRRSQHQTLNLPPGDYVIYEAGHPAWSCALTITH